MRKIYVNFGPMVQEMFFKDTSYLELMQPFFLCSGTICAILVVGIMRNISVKLFEFGLVLHEMFKNISHLELWLLFCSAECNHLCNFGRGHFKEQLFRIWTSGS